jgi:hypothetical protein
MNTYTYLVEVREKKYWPCGTPYIATRFIRMKGSIVDVN